MQEVSISSSQEFEWQHTIRENLKIFDPATTLVCYDKRLETNLITHNDQTMIILTSNVMQMHNFPEHSATL